METTTEQKRELIKDYVNEFDEFTEFIYDLMQINKLDIGVKNAMLKFAGYTLDQCRKVDSAIPLEYSRRIQEIYPEFNGMAHGYDYNNQSFGEMINIVEKFGQAVLTKMYELS